MSFVDLATLALYRRNEMEARIKTFSCKCDQAVEGIANLKMQAQNLVHQLNCEPSELKERFLTCMQQLEEFNYLITDFTMSVGKFGEMRNLEVVPVHDTSTKMLQPTPPIHEFNIMDVLSEPVASTSTACPNRCPLEKPKRKVPKDEQTLIQFSSTSCSAESVPAIKTELTKKEQQCQLADGIKKISIEDPGSSQATPEPCQLPAQDVLPTETSYRGAIVHIDGASLYVITDSVTEICDLTDEMTRHYKPHRVELSLEQLKSLVYCAFYDQKNHCYCRAMLLHVTENHKVSMVEVFLVDTGEIRSTPCALAHVQPLAPQFCKRPPYARCCHLAGVELVSFNDKEQSRRRDEFLQQYAGKDCFIHIDDNSSESLGVYVVLPDNIILNELLVRQQFAVSTEAPADSSAPSPQPPPAPAPALSPVPPAARSSTPMPTHGPPELLDGEMDDPEYDDPVEAVMGYKCRDDADICKHYKGGKEKTCFKGARCSKKHIMKHPDGWTLDRVEMARCASPPLPEPGSWQKARVSCVGSFNRIYVQFVQEKEPLNELPNFGVVLPPTSLEALVNDMNSPAVRVAYKRMQMTPAPYELVAALYPVDGLWYRASVLTSTRFDQNVEVLYVDYGNVLWVKEDAIRQLDARFCSLPAQAVRCMLAGVTARSDDSPHWAAAKHQLELMVNNKTLDAHIIARDYDELTVEFFDAQGSNVAELLAAYCPNAIQLHDYSVVDDTKCLQRHVVP